MGAGAANVGEWWGVEWDCVRRRMEVHPVREIIHRNGEAMLVGCQVNRAIIGLCPRMEDALAHARAWKRKVYGDGARGDAGDDEEGRNEDMAQAEVACVRDAGTEHDGPGVA